MALMSKEIPPSRVGENEIKFSHMVLIWLKCLGISFLLSALLMMMESFFCVCRGRTARMKEKASVRDEGSSVMTTVHMSA